MKNATIAKLLFLTILISLSLPTFSSCAKKDTEKTVVAFLGGSTGIGLAKMIHEEKNGEKYEFRSFDGAENLRDSLLAVNCDIDIAAMPTNLAALLYNKTNGRYRVIALNTLGVLYIAVNGAEVDTLEDLKGKTVYVPEAAPAMILQYVLEANGISVITEGEPGANSVKLDSTYDLVSLPAYLAAGVGNGGDKPVQIALLPEPKLTVAEKNCTSGMFRIPIDITEEWNKVCSVPLVQGCMIASASFIERHPILLADFMDKYEQSVQYSKNSIDNFDNLSALADYVVEAGILPQKPIAISAIPRSHIAFIKGEEMKDSLSNYLSVLASYKPGAIGGKIPDMDFYYIGHNIDE